VTTRHARMPLDKMSQDQIQQGTKREYAVAGVGWRAKDWAILSLAAVTIVVLAGIVVAAMILVMSERKQLTEVHNRTEDRLRDVNRELAALDMGMGQLIAADEASKPGFSKGFPDLLNEDLKRALQNDAPILEIKTATAIVRKARELRIDANPQQIAEVGRGFLRLVEDVGPPTTSDGKLAPANDSLSIAAFETIGELIGYRSFLLPNPLGQPQDAALVESAMLKLPKLHSFKPLNSASGIYGSMQSLAATGAKIDLLNGTAPLLNKDYSTLLVEGYDLRIDGLDVRNVVFSNCKITYSGERVILDNVYFSNCTFEIAPAGRNFAELAFGPSGQVTFTK
jgi:hypothetical protein